MCNANTIFVLYQNSVNKVLRRENKLIPDNNAREGEREREGGGDNIAQNM